MKREERIAFQYLTSKGYRNIIYEPDGNVPPDFLIDDSTAIEVRRLNQHYESHQRPEGLESLQHRLGEKMHRMLSGIQDTRPKRSYFLSYHFRRPIADIDQAVKEVKKVLLDFLEREEDQPAAYKVLDTLNIHVIPASIRHRDVFLLGGYTDLNSGGFLISEIYRNLKICIEDKTKKIERYKSKYPVWWLVLIDNVGYGLSKDDIIELRAVGPLQHDWDRLLLVAPMNPEYGIQI